MHIDKVLCFIDLHALPELFAVLLIGTFQLNLPRLEILQVVVEQGSHKVVFHIVQRRCGPARRLELFLAEFVEMGFKVFVLQLARLADLLLQLGKQIIVSPLLVLDEGLVLKRSF